MQPKKLNNELPKKEPLNNLHIERFAEKHLKNFRGVFMRNSLPFNCRANECGVINLDDSDSIGSHWCAYYKISNVCYYFDSFGNLPPPKEMVSYLGSNCKIFYNYNQLQEYNTVICGHLCMLFLYHLQEALN